jgi:dienelactone hydrolase
MLNIAHVRKRRLAGIPMKRTGIPYLFLFSLVFSHDLAFLDEGQAQVQTEAELRTLESHFPFTLPANMELWKDRKEQLKQHLAISLGLWPEPERTPLNAVEHSRREMEDYVVSCVFFESLPGFYVTGNLYRPKKVTDKCPVILCPYGHFRNGRFLDHDEKTVAEMIARGEESEPSNARSPLQAHCVHLARMGCIVFHYDMVGYADSTQIPFEVAHFNKTRRPNDNDPGGWLFFSPQAEMRMQSIMGLQTWNSIRALDFVQSLDQVDPERIAVTGCSGGGTQTFILAALDSRIKAAFAAAMVSTGMQGGCTCENACNLRTITGNVEIAALFAPDPMGLSAANDWTKTMPHDGFPELKQLYEMHGHANSTFLASSLALPHGYNEIARRTMYAWFNKFLKFNHDPSQSTVAEVYKGSLPADSIYQERPFQVLTATELSVWNHDYPAPAGGREVEQKLTRFWANSQSESLTNLFATDPSRLRTIARSLICNLDANDQDRLRIEEIALDLLGFKDPLERPKVMRIFNESDSRQGIVCHHWPAPGREALIVLIGEIANTESPAHAVLREAIKRKHSILAIDSNQLRKANRMVDGSGTAAYTYGYNRTNLARDARAIAKVIDQLGSKQNAAELWIVALNQTTPIAAVAAAVRQIDLPVARFVGTEASFGSVNGLVDPNFLPGAMLLGDLEGILKISEPKKTALWNVRDHPSLEKIIESIF